MKLRYRDSFGSEAGAAWRLLFVYSLLPWMHKYRIQINGDMGFLLQGLAETTQGRMSIMMSQWSALEEINDESNDILRRDSSADTAELEVKNAQLQRQVDMLIQKQKSLLKTVRDLKNENGNKEKDDGNGSGEGTTEMSQARDTASETNDVTHKSLDDTGTRCEGEIPEERLEEYKQV
jgi:hypothetical protein